MRSVIKYGLITLLAILIARAQSPSIVELRRAFEHPPDDARIMMRWWWFGPAVTKPELEREMTRMKEGGIGGFEVQPVYPLTLEGNLRYLSPEFLDALRFTGERARELGLRMDLTLGSGWPYGGPHIPIAKAAGRLRVARTAPKLADGEALVAQVDGLFFVSSRTRQTVKRPAVGAEGFVLDHYDRSALDVHLKTVGEPMLQALSNTPPYAIFSDSLEVYNTDWTPDFLQEFQKRRGYDLTPYLPALAGDIGERTAAVRHDWARTLTELLDQHYLVPLSEWAHSHNTKLRSQTYGSPPASLSSNALVDLPEGEGSDWRQFSMTRWASSASHLYGRPVTSSETWTWLNSPAFRATPLDMKAEADRHFLEGINQLIGHGWPYSPPSAGEPGWSFYAAAVFNEHNPWWIVMPDVSAYLQRISFLLRQGRPSNDIALYLPTDDAWASFTLGNASLSQAIGKLLGTSLIPRILDAGYDFDFIDDEAIARVGLLQPVLILPNMERIPWSTYQKIEEYARRGGIVVAVGRAPSLAPGLREAETETPRIRELSRMLFASKGARGRLVQDESQLSEALHRAMAPDAVLPSEVGFVHRKLDSADIYFLANTSNRQVRGAATFRDSRRTSQWWDPFSGKTATAGGPRVELDLAPYESRVLVFSDESSPLRDENKRPATRAAPTPIDISSGWAVTFPNSPALAMPRLQSWTDLPDRKYFSGSAAYERTVDIDRSLLAAGREVYLNFGEGTPVTTVGRRSGNGMRAMLEGPVREAAVVYVNGKRAGSVWRPPYEISVRDLLHAGQNTLRVVVANLAINQLAKGPLPDYRELNARFGERFQPQDMANLQPVPSGLLGPIRLIPR
uniref:Glycosyl hydrolase family 2 protein n=1 Tax=uncultured bacterium CSLG10 TaxID=1091576 RepID=G4WV71_9BACT|nr:glycosyl hydrolase family 2 protein [uncultured bacterium CSLG10]